MKPKAVDALLDLLLPMVGRIGEINVKLAAMERVLDSFQPPLYAAYQAECVDLRKQVAAAFSLGTAEHLRKVLIDE
jgi:hypothetical protein